MTKTSGRRSVGAWGAVVIGGEWVTSSDWSEGEKMENFASCERAHEVAQRVTERQETVRLEEGGGIAVSGRTVV